MGKAGLSCPTVQYSHGLRIAETSKHLLSVYVYSAKRREAVDLMNSEKTKQIP